MNRQIAASRFGYWCCVVLSGMAIAATAAEPPPLPEGEFQPRVGQSGKDVVWVPTPAVLVEKMLDVARVTPQDFVMDLGAGDGRNIIAAAKRGATALGVEYNPEMVEHARRLAQSAGVADKAQFVQGDMYEADISRASVLALFLLPENMDKLVPRFLALKPGSRIVANQFAASGWEPDETGRIEGDCGSWCSWLLYIVPARVSGRWQMEGGELALEQKFQMFTGTYTVNGAVVGIADGRLRGEEISFRIGGKRYAGRVGGDSMVGTGWNAKRVK
jgi:SAM-dependent methyltransferase